MKHIAMLTGGRPTGEIDSVLRECGHRVNDIAADSHAVEALLELRPDLVFMAHSRADGRFEGLMELLGIPYTHSGVLASALAADRHQAKIMLRAAGLPVTDHVIVGRAEAGKAHQMPPPYVVKPATAGSHAGSVMVRSEREGPPEEVLGDGWASAETVMVERFVLGRAMGVAVMGDVALAVSESVDTKDRKGGSAGERNELLTPAQISPNIYEKLQKMSLKAHEVLGCRGVTQTSFRYNDQASGDSGIVCLGIDTQPDLTPGAIVPEQARYAGHSFADLVAWMVEDASCSR